MRGHLSLWRARASLARVIGVGMGSWGSSRKVGTKGPLHWSLYLVPCLPQERRPALPQEAPLPPQRLSLTWPKRPCMWENSASSVLPANMRLQPGTFLAFLLQEHGSLFGSTACQEAHGMMAWSKGLSQGWLWATWLDCSLSIHPPNPI